jgi:hypothetical protein
MALHWNEPVDVSGWIRKGQDGADSVDGRGGADEASFFFFGEGGGC